MRENEGGKREDWTGRSPVFLCRLRQGLDPNYLISRSITLRSAALIRV